MTKWWIDQPCVLGISNPTTDELKDLYQQGFANIVSLLDEEQQSPNYDLVQVKAMGFNRYSIPLGDFCAPTLDQFQSFLRTLQRILHQGNVLVHCQGGTGRTGTMGAAYWISKGLTAKQAIERIRLANPSAVETSKQERSLYDLEAFLTTTGHGPQTARRRLL